MVLQTRLTWFKRILIIKFRKRQKLFKIQNYKRPQLDKNKTAEAVFFYQTRAALRRNARKKVSGSVLDIFLPVHNQA